MSKKTIFYLLFFTVLLLGFYYFLFKGTDNWKVKMPILSYVQPFSFTNQDGVAVTDKNLLNKITVVEYFFTTCKGICPKMNANMRRVFDVYKGEENFMILSHSCMPETDTVSLLKAYEQKMLSGNLVKQKDGSYKTEKISAYGKIGFGIATTDQQNGAYNKNGVYRIKTSYNGKPKIDIKFEKISFDETRYLNRYIDYTYFKEHKIKIQKLFRQTNNPLSIITQEDDNGFVNVADGFSSNYTIEIKDYQGNLVHITIPVIGKKDNTVAKKELPNDLQYIPSESSSTIQRGVFTVDFPKNALYQGSYLNIKTSGDTLHLHTDNIPVHKNISISMDISNYNTLDKNKLYIVIFYKFSTFNDTLNSICQT